MKNPPLRSAVGLLSALLLTAAVAPDPSHRDEASAPAQQLAILEHLVGSWEGQGELFGQRTSFAMTWERQLDDRFLGLRYEIRGVVRMSAIAHYRLGADTLRGVWVDSRGQTLTLDATGTETPLATGGGAPGGRGGSVHERVGADSLVVRDYVEAESGWRPFGTARYGRR